jgi:SAM-dependent methyltransferase
MKTMKAQEYPPSFARFYDVIYHQLRDGVDHDFFMNEVGKSKGNTLEIGVGTGRFFVEALHNGHDVYGLDISRNMIEVLKSKLEPREHYRVSHQDMLDFSFDMQFDLIIAPFRVIMHIPEKKDQILALNNVCRHLKPNGRFIFDTFVPDLNQLINGLHNQVDFDGEYVPGKKLRRMVSTKPDLINQVIQVFFTLEWDEDETLKTEVWDLPLRFFFRYELEHLIERSDFSSYRIYGDYKGRPLNESSKEFIVECKK